MPPPMWSTKLSIIYGLKFNKTSNLDSISIVHMNGGYTPGARGSAIGPMTIVHFKS